jgi:hypothetical protein
MFTSDVIKEIKIPPVLIEKIITLVNELGDTHPHSVLGTINNTLMRKHLPPIASVEVVNITLINTVQKFELKHFLNFRMN